MVIAVDYALKYIIVNTDSDNSSPKIADWKALLPVAACHPPKPNTLCNTH
jgi:hypothetical protein